MFEQVTTYGEVAETARDLKEIQTVHGLVTPRHQVWLLTNLFNGGLNLLRLFGGSPVVTVDAYRKQTDTKPRREGHDYARLPGVFGTAHVGTIHDARRTQEGHLSLLLYDHNRQPTPEALERAYRSGKNPPQPFTWVRVAGIRSIVPGAPAFGL